MGSRSGVISSKLSVSLSRWLLLPSLAFGLLISTANAQNSASAAPQHAHKQATPNQPVKQALEPPDTLQQHYDAARTYGLSGDQQHAAIEYKAFLAGALRRMGNALSKEGKPDQAGSMFAAAIAIAPADVDVRMDYAVLELERGDFNAAKSQAEEAVRLTPDSQRAQYILGRALYGLEDFANAKTHLEAAVVAKPNFEMGYTLGVTYLQLKDTNRARLLFDEMITGLGDSAPLHIYFGHAYWETTYYDKAITEYKLALARNPKVPQAHFFLGIAYLSRDEDKGWDEAAQEQREEIKNNPNDFRAHYELGNIALKQHHADEAERELKRASELAPDDPDPLISLGEIYAGQNRPEEAEAAMRKAIALTTDVSRAGFQINRAHYVLGRVLMQTGRREEGAKELKISAELRERTHPEVVRSGMGGEETVRSAQQTEVRPEAKGQFSPEEQRTLDAYLARLKPGIADAYNNLGVGAAGQKDFPSALEYFRKAAQWSPSLPTLDRNIGMAAFYCAQYDQAIPPLYRHLQQSPDDIRARAALALSYFSSEKYAPTIETLAPIKDQVNDDPGLGLAYAVSLVKTNQYDEGMSRLKTLEQSSPDSAPVHVAIGQAFAEQKIYGTAVDEFRKAIAIDPAQSRTHFLLGLALMHQETQAEAAQEFRAALKLDPSNAETKYHLAYSLIQIQQKDEAQALLREVVQQDPKYADAFYQLGKLQLDTGDAKGAIANLETGAKLSPNSEYIHYQLSMAYRRDSRPDDAAREMQLYEAMKQRRRGDHESQSEN